MIKPVDAMTDGERWLWVELEFKALNTRLDGLEARQKLGNKVLWGIAGVVGVAIVQQLIDFIISGGLQVSP